MAKVVGCTTVTELGATQLATDAQLTLWTAAAGEAGFPARLVALLNPSRGEPGKS